MVPSDVLNCSMQSWEFVSRLLAPVTLHFRAIVNSQRRKHWYLHKLREWVPYLRTLGRLPRLPFILTHSFLPWILLHQWSAQAPCENLLEDLGTYLSPLHPIRDGNAGLRLQEPLLYRFNPVNLGKLVVKGGLTRSLQVD